MTTELKPVCTMSGCGHDMISHRYRRSHYSRGECLVDGCGCQGFCLFFEPFVETRNEEEES